MKYIGIQEKMVVRSFDVYNRLPGYICTINGTLIVYLQIFVNILKSPIRVLYQLSMKVLLRLHCCLLTVRLREKVFEIALKTFL